MKSLFHCAEQDDYAKQGAIELDLFRHCLGIVVSKNPGPGDCGKMRPTSGMSEIVLQANLA